MPSRPDETSYGEEPLYLALTLEYPIDLIIPWLTFAYWEGKEVAKVLDDALRKHILDEPTAYVPVPPERQADIDFLIKRAEARREAGESPTWAELFGE